jgi:hypothetical protein
VPPDGREAGKSDPELEAETTLAEVWVTGPEVAATTVASVRPRLPNRRSFCCSRRLRPVDDFADAFAGADPESVGTTSRYWVTAEFPGGATYPGGDLATAVAADAHADSTASAAIRRLTRTYTNLGAGG